MKNSRAASELQDVLSHYDLGELAEFQKNERGFVNTSYAICTLQGGERRRYFLRKYKRGIHAEELLFEHSILEHLAESGTPVARIHHTRSGQTYLERLGSYYTIFDFLPGEDRFSWIDPRLSERQLASAGAVLARLHADASGFAPRGRRNEPRIRALLPLIAANWEACPGRSRQTVFDARIAACLDLVRDDIAATLAGLQEPAALALPETVIHSDYHPGNLMFSGDEVTGVFDFDWSKLDLRLFDVGLALWYFCASWQAPEDGALRLDWARTFLRAYHETLLASQPALGLTLDERRYLPLLIRAGNLYILHWTVLDYFAKEVDPAAYLVFLDHSLNFTRWFARPDNLHRLQAMIAEALVGDGPAADVPSMQAGPSPEAS